MEELIESRIPPRGVLQQHGEAKQHDEAACPGGEAGYPSTQRKQCGGTEEQAQGRVKLHGGVAGLQLEQRSGRPGQPSV